MDPAAPYDEPLRGAGPWQAWGRSWRRILVFTGRASLSEYWWPTLLNALTALVLSVVAGVLLAVGLALGASGNPADVVFDALAGIVGVALGLFLLATALVGVSLGIRRLHDADLSGWLVLLALIPSVGGLIVLVLSLLPANPRGARYDFAAAADAGEVAIAPLPAPRDVDGVPALDAWPEPSAAAPATAPVATAAPAAPEEDSGPWSTVGRTTRIEPPMSAPPAWRQQHYVLVERGDAPTLLATDGLAFAEGASALGPGAELAVAAPAAGAAQADDWELALLGSAARRVRGAGMHLPAELEQWGTLSMSLTGVPAPDGWRTADGAVGVLLGLPVADLPASVATRSGEVALVGLEPLRPAELQEILDGGAAARARIAGRLAAMPPEARARRS